MGKKSDLKAVYYELEVAIRDIERACANVMASMTHLETYMHQAARLAEAIRSKPRVIVTARDPKKIKREKRS